MKITVSEIPDEGLDLDISETLEVADAQIVGPAKAQLAIRRTAGEVLITGSVNVSLDLECSRCLKQFRGEMRLPVDAVYHPAAEMGEERHELRDDEMDTDFYRDDEIDVNELLVEQVMLNLDMKPLCSERCRGLCPVCGRDLNTETCDCRTDEGDPRLAVLKTLLKDRKE